MVPIEILVEFQGISRTFRFNQPTIYIGRDNDLSEQGGIDLSPDKKASRQHGILHVGEREIQLKDWKSRHGVFLNGRKIDTKELIRPGDSIQMGETLIRILNLGDEAYGIRDEVDSKFGMDPNCTMVSSLDATLSLPIEKTDTLHEVGSDRIQRLLELPLQLGAESSMEDLLHRGLEAISRLIPKAGRIGIYFLAPQSKEWELKSFTGENPPQFSEYLASLSAGEKQGIMWERQSGGDLSQSLMNAGVISSICSPLLWRNEAFGLVVAEQGEVLNPFDTMDLNILVSVCQYIGMAARSFQYLTDIRENAAILEKLLTHFSPTVRSHLLQKIKSGSFSPGAEISTVTLLLSDIRGFTRLGACMKPGELHQLLQEMHAPLVETIFKHDGSIDKFIGDAILAVFGSPEEDPLQFEKALNAAIEMQQRVKEINLKRVEAGNVPVDIGIGLHCGEVAHGFIGSEDRLEFTVVGNTVNLAARYCDGAGAGEIVISQNLVNNIPHRTDLEHVTLNVKHGQKIEAFVLRQLT